MTLSIGTKAPLISGTDVQTNAAWELAALAPRSVLIAFSGITWCQPCQAEAPELEKVWQDLKYNSDFSMAIVSVNDNPVKLKKAIKYFGLTFPVVREPFGSSSPSSYQISGAPTLYCLRWDDKVNRHVVGGAHYGALSKSEIMAFLSGCGIKPPSVFPEQTPMFGEGFDCPPAVPVRAWPQAPSLGPAAQDVLIGLRLAEMAAELSEPRLRDTVRRAALEAARSALSRLEQEPPSER